MKILFCASEVVPFAKTGGLADVIGALPKSLKKLGHDVRIVLPKYKKIDENKFSIKDTEKNVVVDIALFKHIGVIKETYLENTEIPVYFIDNMEFFDRDELYRTPQGEYWDNAERFIFFSQAVLKMLKEINFKPDIVHCNDWHTSLIPVYLKTVFNTDEFYKDIKTVFSIHNIAYQGIFSKEKLKHANLPEWLYDIKYMEFYGNVNFMKGGIIFSDIVTTVSERYKEEIQQKEFGYGLDGVLRENKEKLFGVLNGIDYSIWNPAIDPFIPHNYDLENIEEKEKNKEELLKNVGLKYSKDVPLIGLISRLDNQKGLDFIAQIIDELMKFNIQFIVLGTGEEKYHKMFYDFKKKYPEKLSVNIKFDNKLAHNIYAGSDMFLMPSRFEPCGLGQLISLRYGTVPIVRETGGLADTIEQFNFKTKKGNGFIFSGYNGYELLQKIRMAIDTYKNKRIWNKIIFNGMKMRFSWDDSAKKYEKIYKTLIN